MAKLTEERDKAHGNLQELEMKIREAKETRGGDGEREGLIERRLVLEHEVGVLRRELEGYKDADPGEVERRRGDIGVFRAKAERWTDNIEILEGKMLNLMGGDKEKLDGIKREVYGHEYVEGEGLREL